MKTIITLLALCAVTYGAELSNGKSPRVLEIEQKFQLSFEGMVPADNDVWWVFFKTPINPVVVHVDASDEEVSSALETSYTVTKLIKGLAEMEAAKEKKKK